MARYEIAQQSDDMELLVEVSDQVEAACGSGSSDREPMEVDVNANLTFARGGFLHRTKFVLVNDRVPRTDGHCALCGGIIENGYVRDSQTRLIYCDAQCLPGGTIMAMPVIKDRARKVS